MKNPLPLFALGIACLFATSCTRYYYKPNALNVPLFTGGNQVHIDASVGSNQYDLSDWDGKSTFFDLQGAYSPINHLGVIANYSTYNFRPSSSNYFTGQVTTRCYLAEAGVGGYYALGGNKVKMVADLYGGGGIGNLQSDVNMDISRLFIQPGIGMRTSFFDVSFNLRYSSLRFRNLQANGHDSLYLNSYGLFDYYTGKRIDQQRYGFLEPGITLRAGYKFAKVQVQYVFAHSLDPVSWEYSPSRFTVGFYFTVEDLVDMIRVANK